MLVILNLNEQMFMKEKRYVMRFIHTADIHLGHPFLGLQNVPDELADMIARATTTSFSKMVDIAIAENVEFICISGDLFDSQNQSIHLLDFLITQFNRLDAENIMVYLSYGNHDYQPKKNAGVNWPKNVYEFDNTVKTYYQTLTDGKIVAITSFSYGQQHIKDEVINQFPNKQTNRCDFQIGMYHGGIDGVNGNYAPFKVSELLSKGYDYWALGHIHQRQTLNENPFIGYVGSLQGQNSKENGAKGFYLVEEADHKLIPYFEETSTILWETKKISCQQVSSQRELLNELVTNLQVVSNDAWQILNIEIDAELGETLVLRINDGTTTLQLNELLRQSNEKLWINNISQSNNNQAIILPELDQKFWEASAERIFDFENIHQVALKKLPELFISEYFEQSSVQVALKKQTLELMHQELADLGGTINENNAN